MKKMNILLQEYAREFLKEKLSLCSEREQEIFKRMYAFGEHDISKLFKALRRGEITKEEFDQGVSPDMSMGIDEVIDNLPEGKLDWAMQQVINTLKKK